MHQVPDIDPEETQDWLESLDDLLDEKGKARARFVMLQLLARARERQVGLPALRSSDYVNTIPPEAEPWFPGDEHVERRLRAYIRWNAAIMVSKANRKGLEVGGHIATYQSAASLYEVGFNHFFRGKDAPGGGDQVFIQGHASPGIYARAYLEGRLSTDQLDGFRQEVSRGPGRGLSSYPHPRLMPEFWEFPTVSMGLTGINSIYQARFNRYLDNRGIKDTSDQRVWAFLGDGEMGEPESLGAIRVASREGLDNLTWVINCNLQQLDGPVVGNGKVVQELESYFLGAGWHVIKVLWGRDWDPLLAADASGALVNKMNTTPDGQFQTYLVEDGAYIRQNFFGGDPRLHQDGRELLRRAAQGALARRARLPQGVRGVQGGDRARRPADRDPGPDGQGLDDRRAGGQERHPPDEEADQQGPQGVPRPALPGHPRQPARGPVQPALLPPGQRLRRDRLPAGAAPGARRLPARSGGSSRPSSSCPGDEMYAPLMEPAGGAKVATTQAFVRLLRDLMRDKEIGQRIVPIAPDEFRTFGMDSMFPTAKIYNPHGQTYESVDRKLLLSWKEAKNGQLLHEGISEAGAMGSTIAAGSAYSMHGEPMIPVYIFYSMFGFQRTGDSIWAMADQMSRGFLIGATAGRTTLTGEGLQHADGHSPLLASTNPAVVHYDPAFAYEIGHIVKDGLRRMYGHEDPDHPDGENVIYYMTVYNEPVDQPGAPEGLDVEALLRGLYRYNTAPIDPAGKPRAQLLASGRGDGRGAQGPEDAGRRVGRGRGRLVGDLVERAAPRRRRDGRRGTSTTRARTSATRTSRRCCTGPRARSSPSATTCARCRTRSRRTSTSRGRSLGHRRVRVRRHPGRGPTVLRGRRRVDRRRDPREPGP